MVFRSSMIVLVRLLLVVHLVYWNYSVDVHVCSTAIAIRGKDGVVFGVEKLVTSKLYEKGANKRIFNVDRHVGMVRF